MQRSLLCSDVVGFTKLLSRLGDGAALQVVRRHHAIVRGCATAHSGEVLELRGDGFLVGFARSACALACAIDIQRELAADRARHRDGGVHVRISVHTGNLLVEQGSYFGLEVVVPFRLLDFAAEDEILASGSACGEAVGVTARGARDLVLDGIPGRVRALELDWRSATPAPPLEVRVDRGAVAGSPS